MSSQKKNSEFIEIAFAIVFISIILSSVIAIRELKGMPIYPNGESYYNLRIANELAQDPLLEKDPIQDKEYYPSIYHYFISVSIIFFGMKKTIYLAPILMGILSALIFFRLLVNLGFPKTNAGFSAMLLSISPAFIYVFSNLSNLGVIVFLSMMSISFYFERNYWDFPWKTSGRIYFGISIISLCLLSITSVLGFAISILFIFSLSLFEGRSFKSFLFAAFPAILFSGTTGLFTDFFAKQVRSFGFQAFELKEVFSVFGAEIGLDVFLMILYLTGIMIVWSYFKSIRLFHILSILFVGVSFFSPLLRIYASMIISVYCVFAIKHIYYNKWDVEIIKTGTIILLVCALVFSSISEISVLINAEPGSSAKETLSQLESLPPGTVMADEKYGYFIQSLTGKKTLLDEGLSTYPEYQDHKGDYNYMLTLVRAKDAEPMMNKHGIKYIFITSEMKENVWGGKEKELLLLLKNSENFRLASQKDGFELWKYTTPSN